MARDALGDPYENFRGHPVVLRNNSYDPMADLRPRPAQLSVDDIERLAKAGIVIKFEDITDHIQRDDYFQTAAVIPNPAPPNNPAAAIRERWELSKRLTTPNPEFAPYPIFPLHVDAIACGDKVYVFIGSNMVTPMILEDDAPLFPSDGLMARINLVIENSGARTHIRDI